MSDKNHHVSPVQEAAHGGRFQGETWDSGILQDSVIHKLGFARNNPPGKAQSVSSG
ncbi:MAG: hypothetical protein ABL884_10385 [Methyloglobulus sp.]